MSGGKYQGALVFQRVSSRASFGFLSCSRLWQLGFALKQS
jgi:hypothetical protein